MAWMEVLGNKIESYTRMVCRNQKRGQETGGQKNQTPSQGRKQKTQTPNLNVQNAPLSCWHLGFDIFVHSRQPASNTSTLKFGGAGGHV